MAGISERCITGNASPEEKLKCYAEALAGAPGNPLFLWSQMELAKYFETQETFLPETCDRIREQTDRLLKEHPLTPQELLLRSKVEYVATTDSPDSNLKEHFLLQKTFSIPVTPTFRTDSLFGMTDPTFPLRIRKIGAHIRTLEELEGAIESKLDFFVSAGCRFTDLGVEDFPDGPAEKKEAKTIFLQAMNGQNMTARDENCYRGYLYRFLAKKYRERNLVMQWHIGPKRNANPELFDRLGPDCGGDCIDTPIKIHSVLSLLAAIQNDGGLPKTILYCLDPALLVPLAAAGASFCGVSIGAAWWFSDHKHGIRQVLQTVAEQGQLAAFPGMLTDSRSFLSYVRHDYFRRILCTLLGEWVESGEFPSGAPTEKVARKLCYENMKNIIGGNIL